MTRYFRRTEPTFRDNLGAGLVAGGLAAGVAAVTFYLVRVLLAREPLTPVRPEAVAPDTLGPGERPTALPSDGKGQG